MLRIAIRFHPQTLPHWRTRLLASLAGKAEVTTTNPNLFLDLSSDPIDPHDLKIPYWTFIYGETPQRTDPALQDFLKGNRASYARLVRLTTPSSGVILREGSVKTVLHSLRATRERLMSAILDWPARVLNKEEQAGSVVSFTERGGFDRLKTPCATLRNTLTRLKQEITREHWSIGVINAPVQHALHDFNPESIQWLPAPKNGFLADPFGITLPDGKTVILAEALSWNDPRGGRIVTFDTLQDVFNFRTHASYPHLIQHEGNIYCIPETVAQRRVQLFKADPFPTGWILDTVLLEDFPGADATVTYHGNKWWMFVGNHDDQDETKLFIFHAPELRGPWLPHAANPVKCDLRSARPAGPLFTLDGQLYRPAQDCSVTYGGAVIINRIERLTPTEFAEQPFRKLAASPTGPYPDGLHTLSGTGNVTLVDGKRHAVSAAAALLRVRSLCQKLGSRLGMRKIPTPGKGIER